LKKLPEKQQQQTREFFAKLPKLNSAVRSYHLEKSANFSLTELLSLDIFPRIPDKSVAYFHMVFPPLDDTISNISSILGLKMIGLCSGNFSFSWTIFMQNQIQCAVEVTVTWRQKNLLEENWRGISQKKVKLENNIPIEFEKLNENCLPGQRIGIEIDGIIQMELLPNNHWMEEDLKKVKRQRRMRYSNIFDKDVEKHWVWKNPPKIDPQGYSGYSQYQPYIPVLNSFFGSYRKGNTERLDVQQFVLWIMKK